jgi:signal transduction histidine kinase
MPENVSLTQAVAHLIGSTIERERLLVEREEARAGVLALQETTERMDVYLSIASHELRTPLTSLAMYLQLTDYWLNTERGKRTDESAAYMERALAAARPLVRRAVQSSKHLDRLVGDLLVASRVREHRLKLMLARTDLVALIRDVTDKHQQEHPNRSLRRAARL